MSITALPVFPNASTMTEDEYDDAAEAWAAALGVSFTQVNALFAALDVMATGGAFAIPYTVSSTTTDGDPGPGLMRFSNYAAQTSATTLRLDLIGSDTVDYTSDLDGAVTSTSTTKGRFRIVKFGDPTKSLRGNYTAIAGSGYRNLTISSVTGSSAAPFAADDDVVIFFTPNGDKGDTGATGATGMQSPHFGDGSDGAVTISAGTTTLTRNMYYTNLTISGTGALDTAGYQVFGTGTLDLTAAPAGAIIRTPVAGGNAVTNTPGAAPAAMAEVTAGGAGQGLIGLAGVTGNNPGLASVRAVKTAQMHGGLSGATHTAGAGASGTNAGGAAALKPATVTTNTVQVLGPVVVAGLTFAQGGVGGAGGPSGGGPGGAGNSAAGGAGGDGGGVIDIRFHTISRGASTTAGAIRALGGAGGNAGVASATNGGGGSGGAGGGGGFIHIVYATLSGSTATNALDVSGGAGGNGTAGNGTGAAGQGADGGDGGRVRLIDVSNGTVTESVSAVTGSANSTLTGGAGGVARYSL
jgi:hypothetical protein